VLALLLALSLLGGCAQRGAALSPQARQPVDFSGHWELDYGQSDNIQARLNTLVRELHKRSERQAALKGDLAGPAFVVGGQGAAPVIALAQMAELVSRAPLLDVAQDEQGILVKREGDFALDCRFLGARAHWEESMLGRELCGWDGHQLVFTLLLPEGLSIRHRLTLSPDGQQMNVASTVASDQVVYPFTLNRVYQRFDPAATGFHCEQTLTRGRVCTTEGQ
jgi:hypothetical protein